MVSLSNLMVSLSNLMVSLSNLMVSLSNHEGAWRLFIGFDILALPE